MKTGPRRITPEELKEAYLDLALAVSCEIHTCRPGPRRNRLQAAFNHAMEVCKCELRMPPAAYGLHQAAAAADAMTAAQPGYRRDLDG